MNGHQLSKRLAEVASLIPNGSRIADIGTDHAYLPVHLMLQGKISIAIASDVNEGPLQSAQNQVNSLGLDSVIEVRKGDGLEVIEDGEVDVIVIAGMGAALIVQILNAGLEKLDKVKRIIVQPNVAGNLLRQWFMIHRWELKEERIIEEDRKYYEILMVERGDGLVPYVGLAEKEKEQAILMGPFLLKERKQAFIRKWKSEIEKRKKIVSSLGQAQGEEKEDKLKWTLQEIEMMEEGIRA